MDPSQFGKWLVLAGLGLTLIGLLIWSGGKIHFLGRLPGDIRIEKEHFSFYFPLTTCLVLSLFVSVILWLLSKFK